MKQKICVLICLLVLIVWGKNGDECDSCSTREPLIIEPFFSGSMNWFVGSTSEKWEISPTAGAGVRVPVMNIPINVVVVGEFGKTSGISLPYTFTTLLATVALEYEQRPFNLFRYHIGSGVANMLISADEGLDITKPFAGESENEFGAFCYFEPTLVIRSFVVSLKGQYRHIFSSPEAIDMLSISLTGGWRF